MDLLTHSPVSALGVLMAAACTVVGGPVFARGLRALRLRRLLARLREHELDADETGCVLVRGRVALESPLFAPLSGRACAGFELAVRSGGGRVGDTVGEMRAFRLVGEASSARVVPEHAHWHTTLTAERRVAPGEELPNRLRELLERSAEVRWLMSRRAPLVLSEYALEPGAQVSVLGIAHRLSASARVVAETETLAATGTDGGALTLRGAPARSERTPELWIDGDEPLRCVVVSSDTPQLGALVPPASQLTYAVLGPLLTMGGLLYLARAAGALVVGRL